MILYDFVVGKDKLYFCTKLPIINIIWQEIPSVDLVSRLTLSLRDFRIGEA